MSTYHLHARIMVGGLLEPTRNELQSHESDDREEIERLAGSLADRGFAVWVYRHDPGRPCQPDGQYPYTVVAEWKAGKRVQ